MLIAYFDEVKYLTGRQPYQWLAGLVVNATIIRELEDQVSALAQECFGVSTLCKDSEFHAPAIFHRKDNFKEWSDPVKRIAILKTPAEDHRSTRRRRKSIRAVGASADDQLRRPR